MNASTRYNLWLVAEVAQNVQLSKLKVVTNLAVCTLIFIGGFQSGNWSIAIGGMTFVQSINLGELVTAYKEAQRNKVYQEDMKEPPRRKH